MLEEKIVPI